MIKFNERLRKLRIERGELQSDVASALGIKPQSYSAYETGREPKYEILISMAQYFNCTIDYLLGLSNDMNYEEKEHRNELTSKIAETITKSSKGKAIYLSVTETIDSICKLDEIVYDYDGEHLIKSFNRILSNIRAMCASGDDVLKQEEITLEKYLKYSSEIVQNKTMANIELNLFFSLLMGAVTTVASTKAVALTDKENINKILKTIIVDENDTISNLFKRFEGKANDKEE